MPAQASDFSEPRTGFTSLNHPHAHLSLKVIERRTCEFICGKPQVLEKECLVPRKRPTAGPAMSSHVPDLWGRRLSRRRKGLSPPPFRSIPLVLVTLRATQEHTPSPRLEDGFLILFCPSQVPLVSNQRAEAYIFAPHVGNSNPFVSLCNELSAGNITC